MTEPSDGESSRSRRTLSHQHSERCFSCAVEPSRSRGKTPFSFRGHDIEEGHHRRQHATAETAAVGGGQPRCVGKFGSPYPDIGAWSMSD